MVAALVDLVHLPNCKGVFGSIPCGTWSVLRYIRPGPPVLRRLASAVNRWIDETLGIKRTDGTLPDSVVSANLMVEGMVTVASAAMELGKLFAYESPVTAEHTTRSSQSKGARITPRCHLTRHSPPSSSNTV